MKKLMMVVSVAVLSGMMAGCQMWKEMQERQAREEAARKAEMAEKGPVKYFLEKKGTQECINKAKSVKAFDPDFREAVNYSISSYCAAIASLQKVAVVQEGVAIWENVRVSYSEKAKKELDKFTVEDNQAAYNDFVAIATAANATDNDKKRLIALNYYFTWGNTVQADAIAAARKRNADFLAAVVKYTTQAKKIAEKFKKDKLKYAAAIADGLNALNYLSLAGEAAGLEADVMAAAKAANDNLKMVEVK